MANDKKTEQMNGKRTRRSSELVKQEQRERYLEQIAAHEKAIQELKRRVAEIDNEYKKQALLELFKDKDLDELCRLATQISDNRRKNDEIYIKIAATSPVQGVNSSSFACNSPSMILNGSIPNSV